MRYNKCKDMYFVLCEMSYYEEKFRKNRILRQSMIQYEMTVSTIQNVKRQASALWKLLRFFAILSIKMRISIKRFIISFFRFSKIIAVNIYRVRVKHTVFLLYVDTTFPYIFWNIYIYKFI